MIIVLICLLWILVVVLVACVVIWGMGLMASQAGTPLPQAVRTVILVIAVVICLIIMIHCFGGVAIHLPRIDK
jgi:hypothetical protein